MIGLVRMACNLADERTRARSGGIYFDDGHDPIKPRKLARMGKFEASQEYYRIIDRITRGEKP